MRSDGLSKRTVDMYVDAAVLFSGWLLATQPKVHDWEQVGRDHVREFFAWLRAGSESGHPCPHRLQPGTTPGCNGYGKGYVNNVGRCLQQYFAWYANEEAGHRGPLTANGIYQLLTRRGERLGIQLYPHLILQPGLLTLTELGFDAMRERGQPPPIMGGCVD
ncbi:hypothetical protein [Salinispora mooreana]|nr:hypothetical protein [Salinispora mooreana]